jgi:hypothetical protein
MKLYDKYSDCNGSFIDKPILSTAWVRLKKRKPTGNGQMGILLILERVKNMVVKSGLKAVS